MKRVIYVVLGEVRDESGHRRDLAWGAYTDEGLAIEAVGEIERAIDDAIALGEQFPLAHEFALQGDETLEYLQKILLGWADRAAFMDVGITPMWLQ